MFIKDYWTIKLALLISQLLFFISVSSDEGKRVCQCSRIKCDYFSFLDLSH